MGGERGSLVWDSNWIKKQEKWIIILPGVRLAHPVEWHKSSNNIRLPAIEIICETLTDGKTDMMDFSIFYRISQFATARMMDDVTAQQTCFLDSLFFWFDGKKFTPGLIKIVKHYQPQRATFVRGPSSRGFFLFPKTCYRKTGRSRLGGHKTNKTCGHSRPSTFSTHYDLLPRCCYGGNWWDWKKTTNTIPSPTSFSCLQTLPPIDCSRQWFPWWRQMANIQFQSFKVGLL